MKPSSRKTYENDLKTDNIGSYFSYSKRMSKRLIKLQKDAKYEDVEISKLTSINLDRYYTLIQFNTQKISLEEIKSLSYLYGCSYDYLLCESDNPRIDRNDEYIYPYYEDLEYYRNRPTFILSSEMAKLIHTLQNKFNASDIEVATATSINPIRYRKIKNNFVKYIYLYEVYNLHIYFDCTIDYLLCKSSDPNKDRNSDTINPAITFSFTENMIYKISEKLHSYSKQDLESLYHIICFDEYHEVTDSILNISNIITPLFTNYLVYNKLKKEYYNSNSDPNKLHTLHDLYTKNYDGSDLINLIIQSSDALSNEEYENALLNSVDALIIILDNNYSCYVQTLIQRIIISIVGLQNTNNHKYDILLPLLKNYDNSKRKELYYDLKNFKDGRLD